MAEIKEEEKKLAEWTLQKFKDAVSAKEPVTAKWMQYMQAWDNTLYEDASVPSYRSNYISNLIFSTIESMRPIMFDASPKFEAVPVTMEAAQYVGDINQVLDWEWHRTHMGRKMLANSIYTFVLGNSVVFLPYQFTDKPGANADGDVAAIPVNPFNLYPDPLATSVDDAEYLIYADYFHVDVLKRLYPDKADFLKGADIQYAELVNNRNEGAKITNQVLVLEVWARDYTTIEVEEEDGTKAKKPQFPNGRVITAAPELSLILKDEENPYQSGRFPFFLFKDIDVPFQFWGEGEVKWLLSPQEAITALSNQVIDNAKHTANMQWIVDKNAGIPKGELTNRPGLIIRKNPGSEVRRDSPPSMPMYVSEAIMRLQRDIEVVSGVHDVTRGQNPGGIESGSAIMALQEAAQTRIRMKVKIYEYALGELGQEWLERIKQFWKFDRLVPVKKPTANPTTPTTGQAMPGMESMAPQNPMAPAMPGMPAMPNEMENQTYDWLSISQDKQLAQSFLIKIIGASTMNQNKAGKLDLMIRLAQTMMDDGMPVVPRETILDQIPDIDKKIILDYFEKRKQENMAMQQQQQMSEEAQMKLQGLEGQMGQIDQVLGGVQQRFQSEDEAKQRDELMSQGYQQGVQEGAAAQVQNDKTGAIPPELMQQMAAMSDEELAAFLQENPELVDAI